MEGNLVPIKDGNEVFGCIIATYSVEKKTEMQELTCQFKNSIKDVNSSIQDTISGIGNLATMLVSDGETETEYRNVVLVQQVEYADGWYLNFRELSKQELRDMALDSKIEYLAMAADVDLEEV